jgi:hypothetical protein
MRLSAEVPGSGWRRLPGIIRQRFLPKEDRPFGAFIVAEVRK